jgi:hypothetical protein
VCMRVPSVVVEWGVSGWEVGGGGMRGGVWVVGWRGGWVGGWGDLGHESKLCNAFEVVPVEVFVMCKVAHPNLLGNYLALI